MPYDTTGAEARAWPRRVGQFIDRHALIIGVGALVASVRTYQVLTSSLGGCDVHLVLPFAGDAERVSEWVVAHSAACAGVSRDDALRSVFWDFPFAALYGIALNAFLRATWNSWRLGRLRNLRPVVVALPFCAVVLDWMENILILSALDWSPRGPALSSDWQAHFISTAAWAKVLLLASSIAAVVMGIWVTVAPKSRDTGVRRDPPEAEKSPGLGICCSGGGIRAAAYNLGVLRLLDQEGILSKARWLSTVSGGAYVAGALYPASGPDRLTPGQLESYLLGNETSQRHRYLQNDPGGLALALVWLLGLVLVHVIVVAMAVVAATWPVGWLVKQWPWDLTALGKDAGLGDLWDAVPLRLWVPGLVLLALALVVFLMSATIRRDAVRVARWAKAPALLGVALLTCLGVVPILVLSPAYALTDISKTNAITVAGVSLATIGGAVWSIVKKPLARAAPRLGGVLLGIGVVVFGANVAHDALAGEGTFASPRLWGVVTLVLVVWYCFIPMGWASARLMYRTKLRRSFSLRVTGTSVVPAIEQRTWLEQRGSGPELLICATAHRIGLTGNGIPAETFTISPTAVQIGEDTVRTADYLDALPRRMQEEKTISSWQATTGAAVSSAMGRFRFGTTNALLAALNLDLGAWVPNPRRVAAGATHFKAVRLGYLVKEVLGLYDENDDYVFVADGGQWENLGLVELLRRRCTNIICIDASGDDAYSFTTLRQAVALAQTELDGVDVDLTFLDDLGLPEDGGAAPTTVGETTIRYADAPPGRLYYAKAQVAADLSADLRRFAATDKTFPRYSTARQLLGDKQFLNLVKLGHESGAGLAQLFLASNPGD